MRRGCEGHAKGRSVLVTGEKDYDEAAMVRLSHSTMMIEIMRTTMVHGGRKVTGLCTK